MSEKCKDEVREELKGRIEDLDKLFRADQAGKKDEVEDLGAFSEYGLCFDYVAPGTFKNQGRGYFRYQLSWGGPQDEFRFFTDENFDLTRIEYWFLDWWDGAKLALNPSSKQYELMSAIWEYFKGIGAVEAEHKKAFSS